MGPVASQEAIKELGTNGGGFFNANSAHPFENPTPLTNFVEMVLIFAIPAALTYTYGRMARDHAPGLGASSPRWPCCSSPASASPTAPRRRPNPALAGARAWTTAGNMEGKEVRFGVADSALFATVTTDASCGAVNAMHDSFTPLGGLVPLVNIKLGEVVFGGVGAGLYGMLVMVILAVFIAGLMVGRTPEYLGKKIEAQEMKLAMLYVLIFPLRHPRARGLGGGRRRYGTSLAQQRRAARPLRDPVRVHERSRRTTARRSRASTPTRRLCNVAARPRACSSAAS